VRVTRGFPAARQLFRGRREIDEVVPGLQGRRVGKAAAAPPARRALETAVEIGVRFLEIADDLEVDPLDLREVDLLDVDEAQQLAHRLGHVAAALVARASALRHPDLGPELLLVQTQPPPDLAGVEYTIEDLQWSGVW
jgi:hypothetical protein